MASTVALIHTAPSMIPVFKQLAEELLPASIKVFNMVDESLLCDIIRDGRCPPATARRLVGHVLSAEQAGADIVMVTCSSMGRAVEAARSFCAATILRVDEPMADEAVATGARIGVMATLPSTLEPTADLIRRRAAAAGKPVELKTRLVEGAFAAVMGGDGPQHDALVAAALRELSGQVDVIVLAQASMARIVDTLPPAEKPVPILSSPRSGMKYLAGLVRGDRSGSYG